MMRRRTVWVLMAACVLAAFVPAAIAAAGPASVEAASATAAADRTAAVPELALTATPATLTSGDAAILTARLGVAGATVRISRKAVGATDFTALGSFVTDAAGLVKHRVLPRVTTTYRVDYAGDDMQWAPASAEATVSVRPRILLTATETVYRGRRARLSVRVAPVHAGGAVVVELWRDGEWWEWRTVKLDAASRAVAHWRADRVGRQPIRVRMDADAEHLPGRSVVRRVAVRRLNPYNVPVTVRRIIVVDKSQYRLYFFSYGREVKSFPCVLGRPGLPTPTGHFKIYAKGMWPGGPFGARIMSYHSPYAIHGTNEPRLLSRFPRNFSHGCTRLHNANAVWLYDHAPVGTPVWNVP